MQGIPSSITQLDLGGFVIRVRVDGQERVVFPLMPMLYGRLDPRTGAREAVEAQFGLVPAWVGAARGGAKFGRNCYNARTETVFEKPSFRQAILTRRAVVPVDCFYEFPDKEAPLRHRYRIRARDGRPFWLGAIWERNEALGLESMAVLTTGPMDLLAPFHSRSPLILDDDGLAAWLDPERRRPAAIAECFTVQASGPFEAVAEPWGPERKQGELF
jgi:putative SOS response-associated peptidase YedK